jgi:hypothetical protein
MEYIGKIESKEEKGSAKGTFFKVKVNNLTFNVFNEKLFPLLKLGDNVKVTYTESQGDFNGKPVTYKNVVNIEKSAQISSSVATDDSKVRSMSLSYAKDLWVADKIERKDVLELAEVFVKYIKDGLPQETSEEIEQEDVE